MSSTSQSRVTAYWDDRDRLLRDTQQKDKRQQLKGSTYEIPMGCREKMMSSIVLQEAAER